MEELKKEEVPEHVRERWSATSSPDDGMACETGYAPLFVPR
jgi:hypothetical protein